MPQLASPRCHTDCPHAALCAGRAWLANAHGHTCAGLTWGGEAGWFSSAGAGALPPPLLLRCSRFAFLRSSASLNALAALFLALIASVCIRRWAKHALSLFDRGTELRSSELADSACCADGVQLAAVLDNSKASYLLLRLLL